MVGGLPRISEPLLVSLEFLDELDGVPLGPSCNSLLQDLAVRKVLREGPHVFEVPRWQAVISGKPSRRLAARRSVAFARQPAFACRSRSGGSRQPILKEINDFTPLTSWYSPSPSLQHGRSVRLGRPNTTAAGPIPEPALPPPCGQPGDPRYATVLAPSAGLARNDRSRLARPSQDAEKDETTPEHRGKGQV